MNETSRLEETNNQNEHMITSQKTRLQQLETINMDLERQLADSMEELTQPRND